MSSMEASTAKRKRGPLNVSRPRSYNGRTASLPTPKVNTLNPGKRPVAAPRGRIGGRTSAIQKSNSNLEIDLLDDEAEEAPEEDADDESEDMDGEEIEESPLNNRGITKAKVNTTVITSSPEPEYMLAELVEEIDEREQIESSDPQVPPKLITRLLYYHLQHDKTRIAKDANMVVAKYIDVFVRESIARATHERRDKFGNDMHGVDNFLEVEDLEKACLGVLLGAHSTFWPTQSDGIALECDDGKVQSHAVDTCDYALSNVLASAPKSCDKFALKLCQSMLQLFPGRNLNNGFPGQQIHANPSQRCMALRTIKPLRINNQDHWNDLSISKLMTMLSACGTGLSFIAFAASLLVPYWEIVDDPVSHGKLIIYCREREVTVLDETGLNVTDTLDASMRPSSMCAPAQMALYLTYTVFLCDIISTIALLILQGEKMDFEGTDSTIERSIESQGLSRSSEQESPRVGGNASHPENNQTEDIEMSDLNPLPRAMLSMRRSHDYTRATEPPSPWVATATEVSQSHESQLAGLTEMWPTPHGALSNPFYTTSPDVYPLAWTWRTYNLAELTNTYEIALQTSHVRYWNICYTAIMTPIAIPAPSAPTKANPSQTHVSAIAAVSHLNLLRFLFDLCALLIGIGVIVSESHVLHFFHSEVRSIAIITGASIVVNRALTLTPEKPNSEDISSGSLDSLPATYAQLKLSSHHATVAKAVLGLAASTTAVVLAAVHYLPMMRNDIRETGSTELWTCASDSRGRNAQGIEVSLPPELARLCGDAETAYILMYVVLVLDACMLSTAVVGYAKAKRAGKTTSEHNDGTSAP
ncbi:hypothetical protein KEM54_005267 [Ascosphaera aggregata]|nr:hypothetical protein KEM54_005267 [Ascosphaera aggregata]